MEEGLWFSLVMGSVLMPLSVREPSKRSRRWECEGGKEQGYVQLGAR